PDERGEGAACAERRTATTAQGKLGIALRLLLERYGQDTIVFTRSHVRSGHDRRGGTDRACRMDAQHWFAGSPQCVGQVELGLHHTLEEVWRLAQHDRVDVVECHLGVVEGAEGGLADQAPDRDV